MLILTVGFSLPIFSIVGRQMGASVTRKGVFDHSEAWVHYEEYERWWWGCGSGGEVGQGTAEQEPVRFVISYLG